MEPEPVELSMDQILAPSLKTIEAIRNAIKGHYDDERKGVMVHFRIDVVVDPGIIYDCCYFDGTDEIEGEATMIFDSNKTRYTFTTSIIIEPKKDRDLAIREAIHSISSHAILMHHSDPDLDNGSIDVDTNCRLCLDEIYAFYTQ